MHWQVSCCVTYINNVTAHLLPRQTAWDIKARTATHSLYGCLYGMWWFIWNVLVYMECVSLYGMCWFTWNVLIIWNVVVYMECGGLYGICWFIWNVLVYMECVGLYGIRNCTYYDPEVILALRSNCTKICYFVGKACYKRGENSKCCNRLTL